MLFYDKILIFKSERRLNMEDKTLEMEMMETEGTELDEFETGEGIGTKAAIKIGVAVVAGAVGLGLLVRKGLKAMKKDDEPKKKKKFHVGWVDVDEPEVIEVEAEVVED